MNEAMEAEMTEMDSRTDNLAVSEEEMLMKLSQSILEKKKSQKHIKKQWAYILIILTLIRLEQKWIQQNRG